MGPLRRIVLAVVMLLAATPVTSLGSQIYMEVTFDDKPIGQAIGTGGVTVGEPTWVDSQIEATVWAAPFESRSLEIHCTETGVTRNLGFELPAFGSVSSGLVVIQSRVWFEQAGSGASPALEVFTQNWSFLVFVTFVASGTIRVTDPSGIAGTFPSFPKSRPLPVLLKFDMDAGTYSAWIDDTLVVSDRAHGVASPDFARVTISTGSGNDPDNRFWLDHIFVTDTMPEVGVERVTWGRIRELYR